MENGEIPWRNCTDDADRLARDENLAILPRRRYDLTINATRLFGKPLDVICAEQHLGSRLGERLALFEGQHAGEDLHVVTHDPGHSLKQRRALRGRRQGPRTERRMRGGDRLAGFGRARPGDGADGSCGRRVLDGQGRPVPRAAPSPADKVRFFEPAGLLHRS